MGQNFLTDEEIVKDIVSKADVTSDDLVIEVGAGVGTMTIELAKKARRVVAIEIDKKLIPALSEVLEQYDNVEIINEDAMKIDMKKIIEDKEKYNIKNVKVVANLPYYITTPLIMMFLEEVKGIDEMVFMIQKEVADRICAGSGGKDYGALTVAVQYYTMPRKVLEVPPQCFVPQPEVHSTVIKLIVNKTPPVELKDEGLFFRVVKAGFGQRRKTLLNALTGGGLNLNKETIRELMTQLEIDEKRRGETLSIKEFADLSNLIFSINSKKV